MVVSDQPSEGLRERKKRLMRELISSTATEMFLERGFDEVKVTEIAEACDISEKTVYNYFPTKESLLLDREEPVTAAIRHALGPGATTRSPVDAALEVLEADLQVLQGFWHDDPQAGLATFARFAALVDSTDSLRAAQRDMADRLVQVAAEALARRAGVSPDDPEPQIAAQALIGLWRIQFTALRRHATEPGDTETLLAQVRDEVRRAARVIDAGLWSFSVMVAGRGNREQMRAAAEAAHSAGRQVASALRQARATWKDLQLDTQERERAEQLRRKAQGQAEQRQAQARGQAEQRRAQAEERRRQAQEQAWQRREDADRRRRSRRS